MPKNFGLSALKRAQGLSLRTRIYALRSGSYRLEYLSFDAGREIGTSSDRSNLWFLFSYQVSLEGEHQIKLLWSHTCSYRKE